MISLVLFHRFILAELPLQISATLVELHSLWDGRRELLDYFHEFIYYSYIEHLVAMWKEG
jgi:hypothetical protein